jgi:hypothetical protein
MINFRLAQNEAHAVVIVEIFNDEKLVGVLYPQANGVRLVSRFLQEDSIKLDTTFPTAVEIMLP